MSLVRLPEQESAAADICSYFSSYSVTREYKEFLTLYAFLAATYTKEGVIVPPPPTATSLKTVATVAAMSPDEDLSSSSASEVSCLYDNQSIYLTLLRYAY